MLFPMTVDGFPRRNRTLRNFLFPKRRPSFNCTVTDSLPRILRSCESREGLRSQGKYILAFCFFSPFNPPPPPPPPTTPTPPPPTLSPTPPPLAEVQRAPFFPPLVFPILFFSQGFPFTMQSTTTSFGSPLRVKKLDSPLLFPSPDFVRRTNSS